MSFHRSTHVLLSETDADRLRPRRIGYWAHMRDLLPEEEAVGSDDPEAQTEAIMQESEERTASRDAAPGSRVEHRTSDEATPPA